MDGSDAVVVSQDVAVFVVAMVAVLARIGALCEWHRVASLASALLTGPRGPQRGTLQLVSDFEQLLPFFTSARRSSLVTISAASSSTFLSVSLNQVSISSAFAAVIVGNDR